jgi:hypothetical protein
MSGEVLASSGQSVLKPRRRRRQHRAGAARTLLQPQPESSLEYPGFFVLPRSKARVGPESLLSKLRRWWSYLKATLIVTLVVGTFMGALIYFFVAAATEFAIPTDREAPMVSDPKTLNTNKAAGLGRD